MATEYASAGVDGKINYAAGGDKFCLMNVNFIMLYGGSICFQGSYPELMNSELPYIHTFTA